MTMPYSPYMLSDSTDYGNPPGLGPLRPNGISDPAMTSTRDEAMLPSTPSMAVKRQMPALTVMRDLYAGNEAVHAKGPMYLPLAPREDVADWRIRLARSVLFNQFRQTILGLTGFVFRTPPELGEDVPPKIVEDWENIDLAGTHGDVFARDLMADALVAGHAAILVEYPRTGGGRATYADDLRYRPYWVPLTKDQIVSWRTTVEEGATILTQLVVRECAVVPVGAFGETLKHRYRVFFRARPDIGAPVVGWKLLEVTDQKSVVILDEGLYPTQVQIPVSELPTAGRRGLFDSEPPFADLAWLNLAHYRIWSDYDSSMHMSCVPLLFTKGMLLTDPDGNEVPIGPNTGLNSPSPDGDAKYVTHDGAALDNVRRALEDLENRMAALGLAALATEKRSAETATAKKLDKGATDSTLAVSARGVQDCLERALDFHARYYGLPDGGSVEINTNFDDLTMDAPTMVAWGQLASALSLPPRVVIEALIIGGKLPEETDVAALEQEMLANTEAERERERLEAETKVAALARTPGTAVAGRPEPR